ncbi:response regulator [Paenibacillus yanchengensis]|uniref:Response regulator n=1 Tax=Paenibacillus yanchengensis TaxID=2035833 RepID=A0ABW4YG13_9BACL
MIQALIVDDEKLVRKGLIAMMPWEQYDIEIIGEANNGKTALEFLQHESVDLLFSDLSMPVMDGFDLMKEVRQSYPDIQIVVLTCHQDFEFIQETLRLGAIDYIVKTQIEQDSMEEVLARIARRVQFEKGRTQQLLPAHSLDLTSDVLATNDESNNREMFAYLIAERQALLPNGPIFSGKLEYEDHWRSIPTEQVQSILQQYDIHSLLRIGQHGAILPLFEQDSVLENQLMQVPGLLLLQIPNIKESEVKQLTQMLQRIGMESFFYYQREIWQGSDRLKIADVERQQQSVQKSSNEPESWAKLEQEWLSFQWLTDVSLFTELLLMTRNNYPAPSLTLDWLKKFHFHWKPFMTEQQVTEWQTSIDSICFWEDTVHSLQSMRQSILQMMQQYPYYKNIIVVIAKALYNVRSTGNYRMSRDELADKFNISRSYFSQCFKDIVGTTYGNYIKVLQIERAKELLQAGDEPIYWIAEHCGYKDEKYFSKLFKEETGLSPSTYRKEIKERRMHDEILG